eukprot:TRINITY_DN3182_c0_g1_i1.p1 TRINITY_DN3182_c0_g1~~TRINITY_DN3182_c0_g1_i1.p1  ORF type:complete len:202 (+),score=67.60 TRINITY_DN3182_c0_g1_i1:44-649(+)
MAKYAGTVTSAINRVRDNDPELTYLNLSDKASYQMRSPHFTNLLVEAMQGNTQVTELLLGNLKISDSTVGGICDIIRSNNTITELHLNGNNLGSDGLTQIADALRENSTLLTINLMGNQRFGEGALANVIEMFEYNTTLVDIQWTLHSRASFAINSAITRNKEIARRLAAGMSIDDLDPTTRKQGATSAAAEEDQVADPHV